MFQVNQRGALWNGRATSRSAAGTRCLLPNANHNREAPMADDGDLHPVAYEPRLETAGHSRALGVVVVREQS